MTRSTLRLPFDGKRLRTARKRAGYNQEELAQLCTQQGTSVSRFQVVRAESGKYMPQPAVLTAFVRALDIELDELLTPLDAIKAECAS